MSTKVLDTRSSILATVKDDSNDDIHLTHNDPLQHRHLFIIYGPTGCGKSTVGQKLAAHLEVPFIEGDSSYFHSTNQQLTSNLPLTDAERWDWLIRLRGQAVQHFHGGSTHVVLSCSALKQKYRDVIRIIALETACIIHFIYLRVGPEILLARARVVISQFRKETMIQDQLAALEEPHSSERDIIVVDVDRSLPEVLDDIIAKIGPMINIK